MLRSIPGAGQRAEPRPQTRSTAEHEQCSELRHGPYAATVWEPRDFIASPQDAEEFAAVHLRGLGYDDAVRTPTGPDGGVDVRSSRALAQVKQTATQVGRPDVQRLVGARGREHHLDLVFYSAVGYSRPAIEYGEHMGVALFVYDAAGEVTAANAREQRGPGCCCDFGGRGEDGSGEGRERRQGASGLRMGRGRVARHLLGQLGRGVVRGRCRRSRRCVAERAGRAWSARTSCACCSATCPPGARAENPGRSRGAPARRLLR
ncbi:restriction endonuclease [Cellulosimicrobium cellulans]|uniref:restriction endonuclease n=1 Tax=Cellulosimicrobium cellulans TaxID=1710 RepID=UPI003806F81C